MKNALLTVQNIVVFLCDFAVNQTSDGHTSDTPNILGRKLQIANYIERVT
jgi:hypothetical protein